MLEEILSKNSFSVTADREDYSIGLKGYLNIDGFSGHGEGWFNNTDVKEFCSKISDISKSMVGNAELLGTQSKADGSEYLERMCIRVYVLSNSKVNGVIGVHITLSEYPYTDCREQEILKVSGELKIRNRFLGVFSENLMDLMDSSVDEIRLVGDLDIF